VKGYLEVFDALPGLLLSIPVGLLADVVGRKFIFATNLALLACAQFWVALVAWFTSSLRLTWFEAVCGMVFGGKITAEFLFCCIITDITPRDELTTTFFRLNAISQSTNIIGPMLSAAIMHINPWLSMACGLVLLTIAALGAFAVPETLQRPSNSDDGSEDTTAQSLSQIVRRNFRQLTSIWSDWRLIFLLALYPSRMLTNAIKELLQLYVSNRYSWSLANATFLYSLQAMSATLVLFFLLPMVGDAIVRRYKLSAIAKNVTVARAAFLLLAVAYAIQGLAPGVAWFIIGLLIETLASGLSSALRAMAGSLVAQEDNGRVFSVLAIAETVSSIGAYPATTALFNIGLVKGGGAWLGLPFGATAIAALVAFIAMTSLRFE